MRDAPRARAVALAVLVVCSIVAGVASPAVASSPADPPSGMVGVSASNIEDLRPADMETNVTADQLDGAVYVSDDASTTEVSIVTGKQAKTVAKGASPAEVAGDAVCSSPAAGKNPVFDCGTNFALVISDDTVDAGRDVAIRTSVLKDALGFVPRQITVANNETGETWSYVAERENGWLVASVEHFSSNSVTWSGSVNITASPASDGSSYSYDVADLDSASNVTVNLTGKLNSEWDNETKSGVSPSSSNSISLGGTQVTGPGGTPELTVTNTGASDVYSPHSDQGDGTSDGPMMFVGDDAYDNGVKSELKIVPSITGTVDELSPYISGTSGADYGATVDIYIVQEEPDLHNSANDDGSAYVREGTKVKDNWDPDWTTGYQNITLDTPYDVTAGTTYTVEFVSNNHDGDGNSDYLDIELDSSASSIWAVYWTNNYGYDYNRYAKMGVHIGNPTRGLSASDDEGTSVSIGDVPAGESKTVDIDVNRSSDYLNFSGSGGSFDYTLAVKEQTVTQDPGVELNNGNWANHTGTLADGNTVSLTIDKSHINQGSNTVNVSVGDGSLSADAPAPVVGLTYTHDAADTQAVEYAAGKWIEQYNVSKTYSSDRQNPTLTIPFNQEMAKLERAEYRINGGTWQTASYSWSSGTTLVVELPDVQAGDTVTVVANGTTISSNGEVKVIEPTPPGQRLDSKIQVTQLPSSGDVYVAVGGTADGDRVHYLYDESWDADEHSIIEADGSNRVYLPNAAADGTARVTTWPLVVEPSSGAVIVDEVKGTRSEPGVLVGPSVDGSTTVQYTFVNAEGGVKYNLYSQRGIVRDSGTANSPLTLEDDDSSETLLFRKENTSSTDDTDDPRDPIGQFAKDQASAFSSFDMLGIAGLGLVGLAGAVVVVRRRRDGDGGGSSGSSSATGSVVGSLTSGLEAILGQAVGLLNWFVTNPKMSGALLLLGGIGAVVTGVISLPPGTGILLIAVGVPLLTYFAMRKLDRFNPLVFGTVSVGAMVLGLQLLGGNLVESFLTALGPGALILALAALYVIYRAIKAYQAAASAPEEVNQINIGDDDNDENN